MEGTMVVVVVMVLHREDTEEATMARPRATPQPTALKEGAATADHHLPTTCTRGVHLDLKGATEGAHLPREGTRGVTGVHPKAGTLHHHSKAEGATVPDNGTKVQLTASNCRQQYATADRRESQKDRITATTDVDISLPSIELQSETENQIGNMKYDFRNSFIYQFTYFKYSK